MSRARAAAPLIALAIAVGCAAGVEAQSHSFDLGPITVGPSPSPTASFEAARAIEREAHSAILAEASPAVRDRHVERALELSRRFAAQAPGEAEAHYWLALSLGLKTEYSGAVAKLTTGKECYEVTLKALELDPEHAGAHELLGRIHAGVMRLPWLVRKLGATLGMNDALGDASWESAEVHLRRSAELDDSAIAPRLELAKLLADRGREAESREWLQLALAIEPSSDLDRAMLAEARAIAGGGPDPGDPAPSR